MNSALSLIWIGYEKCGQATAGIEHLLRALWHSEFLFRLHEYRTGVILLADAGLEFGMSKRSRMLVEGIMPQVNHIYLRTIEKTCLTAGRRSSVVKTLNNGVSLPLP